MPAARHGPLGVRVFFTGAIDGNPAELEVFVHADRPRIDCDARVYVIQPRSGYFLASVTPSFAGQLHVDIPFGVEPRHPEQEPYDLGNIERYDFESFWGFSWADLSDGARGLAIFTEPGQQGFRYHDGRLEHFLLKTIAPENLRGGRWTTRHRTGLGYQDFRFAILLHEGDWQAAQLYREVERFRQPLDGCDVLYRLEGERPDAGCGLTVEPENVMLSGIFRDDDGVILRLYENEGAATKAKIELPFVPESVEIVNLLNHPIADTRVIELDGTEMVFDIGAWEIVTLRFNVPEEEE